MRYLSLTVFLFAFWLALSGHYTPALVVAGAASAALSLLAAIRIRIVDEEGHPVELLPAAIT
jgi:multicomponent Na+:H+ antiporter subunit E